MKNKRLVLLLFSLLAIVNCKCTTIQSENDRGYFPLTQGSSWVFEEIMGKEASLRYAQINGDSVINNINYVRLGPDLLHHQDEPAILFRRSNDTVYYFSGIDDIVFLIERNAVEWNDTNLVIDALEIEYFSIKYLEKYEVSGKTYNSVLHFTKKFNYISSYPFQEMYFAKNVGLIEVKRNGITTGRLKKFDIK